MKRALLLPAIGAVLLLILGAGGNDVAGYRSGKNVWLLGAKLKDVVLQGFREIAVDNPEVSAYYDPSRTIQFEKQDTEVSVALFEHDGKLAGVVIGVVPGEKSFKYLRTYYSGRLSGCDQTLDEADHCVWRDEQDDFLILIKDELNDGSPVTLVMYVRGESVLGTNGPTVPVWLRDLLSGD